MKEIRRRIARALAVFCALTLLLTVPSPPASAAADVYFTSVNDKLLELTSGTMPELISGILYLPYTVFDGTTTGVNLGVFYTGNKTQNTFILYSRQKTLVFDLSANNCYDSAQTIYRYMAVTRNNRLYIPVSFVCDFFGLTYSYTATDIAPLIRIKNEDFVLSDKAFINSATSLMQSRYNDYLLSQTPSAPETPSSGGTGTGTVTPPVVIPTEDIPVRLAFLCSGGGNAGAILDSLDDMNLFGLFLFSPDALAENDDIIRRIVGSGHMIGLIVPGSGEQDLDRLGEGNRLLQVIARTEAHIVYLPGLSAGAKTLLEREGWTCWTSTISGIYTSGTAYSAASKINTQLDRQKSAVYLLLDDGALSAGALPRILRHLDDGSFTVLKTFETQLSDR